MARMPTSLLLVSFLVTVVKMLAHGSSKNDASYFNAFIVLNDLDIVHFEGPICRVTKLISFESFEIFHEIIALGSNFFFTKLIWPYFS